MAFKNNLLHSKLPERKTNNLTKEQRAGILALQNNPDIVIKKADKGSAVVVMNTKDYLREGYRQVVDKDFYTKIDHDPTNEVSERITEKLIQMRSNGLISEKNLDYLKPTNCKHGQFYLLPKIDKKGIPGRPICSSVNHPTANISKFVAEHIKQYVPTTKSYIRDTQDFISKITQLGPIPEGAILATLDVTSLYTNIPNHEEILAIGDNMRKDTTKGPIATYILDLLKLVLHNMYFEFNNEFFLQTGGTAMSTSLAPNYANLFMDRFESKALANYPLKMHILPETYQDSMFTSHHTGKQHKCINLPTKPLITCEISNIGYLIQCTKCGKQYIGETERPFRNRIYEHIASVKNNKTAETPVSKHFHSEHHNHNNMRFSVIQWLGTTTNPKTQEVRRAKELSFIWEVPTINPIGINQFV